MKVVCLSREDLLSAWHPEGYGEVVGESANFYIVRREDVNVTSIYPKKARFHKCEIVDEPKTRG